MDRETILLIDGDTILHRAAFGAERRIEWEPGQFTLTGDLGEAQDRVRRELEILVSTLSAHRSAFVLSDSSQRYWRNVVYPDYKQHRTGARNHAFLYPEVRAWANECMNPVIRDTMEADDTVGILATGNVKGFEKWHRKIIVSIDKDMNSVPGLHFNPDKPDWGVYEVTEEEADKAFYTQATSGDATDGYPGCPKLGPKRARKLVDENWPNPWPAIVAAYEKAGHTEEFALSQARVARILRACDYDFKTKSVRFWAPPKKRS
jgi:5'-3' exonuclease